MGGWEEESVVTAVSPQVRTYEAAQDCRRNSSAVSLRRSSLSHGLGGRRMSVGGRGERERSNSVWSDEESSTRRRKSIMMDTSLKGFRNMLDNTESFMEEEIEQLPIRIQE